MYDLEHSKCVVYKLVNAEFNKPKPTINCNMFDYKYIC